MNNTMRKLNATLDGASARWRRGFSARLARTLKQAKWSTHRIARRLQVQEGVVRFWLAGVINPNGQECLRLSQLLQVDLVWLCAIEA